MGLRDVRASSEHPDTAITQDKDTSFDPRISNVALQSNQRACLPPCLVKPCLWSRRN